MLSEDGDDRPLVRHAHTAPQDEATEQLIGRLRGDVLDPVSEDGSGVDVLVSSFTAMGVDFSDYLGGRYPYFFAAILGLSFLLLMARVPLAARAAQGRARQPAVDRRRLRHRRGASSSGAGGRRLVRRLRRGARSSRSSR